MPEIEGQDILDIIVGRVNPYIYAFKTNSVPNSIKVGDTVRGVNTRLKEWESHYPNLNRIYEHIASIPGKNIYFRDYSVHQFLIDIKYRTRLLKKDFNSGVYYSQEFFRDATKEDLEEAIVDITKDANNETHKYQFYDFSGLPQNQEIIRSDKPYEIRDLQQDVIDRFNEAVSKDRDNLLMYAVMRFGKTFTALCCAKELDAKLIIVVSAKGDVLDEWRQNVLTPKQFENYIFLTQKELSENNTVIQEYMNNDKTVVVFLTLQDLQGPEIKEKHSEVFKYKPDLLIIDETHFGARADEFGKVLEKSKDKNEDTKNTEALSDDDEKFLKELNAKVRLHLSGTPYNIIIGNEFTNDDIIAFCQYTDILKAKEKWYKENIDKDEWENPYYGFPQMIRFAFTPSEKARNLLENLHNKGVKYDFYELFATKSTSKQRDNSHREFIHKPEVLEMLQAIDGSKQDKNILSFLDNERIKRGEMCRHLVVVLPYRSSCDAMAELLKIERSKFNNLCDYEIINIAGHDNSSRKIARVKSFIAENESEGKKTISLTVNRMLTGCTVPQWDTMIFLKNTKSAQEYDQASFRIQSQFITEYKDDEGKVIKRDMKPQTILVDFDPDRMFRIQERRSFISTVFSRQRGLDKIIERIADDIAFSPIITLNARRLREITPQDVISSVIDYSRKRSASDEASDLPIDYDLLNDEDILKYVSSQEEIDAKKGWSFNPHTNDIGDDFDDPDVDSDSINENRSPTQNGTSSNNSETKERSIEKQFATLYVRILFFAYLTNSDITSLKTLIEAVPENADNVRILKNLSLNLDVLRRIEEKMDIYKLRSLDNSIQLINRQMKDESIPISERITNATRKFGRMSISEVVTPDNVADEMVGNLPDSIDDSIESFKILDIASKQGEFARALYKRFGEKVKNNIFSIPTSPLAYEFTRKIYKLLDLPIKNIFTNFTSYDLIGQNNASIIQQLKDMKFNAIVGNPPYQIQNEGKGNGADPVYHLFIDVARQLSNISTLIHPARFLFNAGKTPKSWNAKILSETDFKVVEYWSNSNEVFSNVDVKGGIATTMTDKSQNFGKIGIYSPFKEVSSVLKKVTSNNFESFANIVSARDLYKLTEKLYEEHPELENRQSSGHRYDIGSSIFEIMPDVFHNDKPNLGNYIGIFGLVDNKRVTKWIKRSYVKTPESIDSYKIFVPKSNGTGAIGEVLSTPVIGVPVIGHTLTFLSVGKFFELAHAEACLKYIKTRFARLLLGSLKVTQDNSRSTWANIPLQDFTEGSDIDWSQSVADIDRQLYKKYNLTEEEITFIESMIKPM